jgi:RNA polymerase sigma-70 factor, ECF subfamily
MVTDSDIELMLNFKEGDKRAFQLLFDKYQKKVISFCFRYCGHRIVAEELAQETFLRVYKAPALYRPEARFSTWLFKIATNVCLNEIRKPEYRARIESIDQIVDQDNHTTRKTVVDPAQPMPDTILEKSQEQALIHQAIALLPKKQRAALLLKASEGFSYKEIGLQINCSEKHVKALIHRGRQRMIKLLGELLG